MAAYQFTFSRRAIINEVYKIEANSEDEAREMLSQGWYGDPVSTEYCEWYDHDWDLDDTECIDPLVRMVKEYEEDKKESV
jgi:hypothetical protein